MSHVAKWRRHFRFLLDLRPEVPQLEADRLVAVSQGRRPADVQPRSQSLQTAGLTVCEGRAQEKQGERTRQDICLMMYQYTGGYSVDWRPAYIFLMIHT